MAAGVVSFMTHLGTFYACSVSIITHLGRIFCLSPVSRDRDPELWGRLQNNLAVAYTRRVEGDRSQNFEQAIACYQVALKVRTDADWASSQWHLGTAYSQRILGA